MELGLPPFIEYLKEQKNASESTVSSYQRDLRRLEAYLQERGVEDPRQVTATNLSSYVLYLERMGLSSATVSRNVASIRSFFRYIFYRREIDSDPASMLRAPHIEKHAPGILSVAETECLLAQPSGDTAKELRDRAMMELLYATGMRVGELVSLKMGDLHRDLNYVVCRDGLKERTLPFGESARRALDSYLKKGRGSLLKGRESECLFVNCSGQMMSRQGFWKLMKQYASRAGITAEITPQILRHSFAVHMLQNGMAPQTVQKFMDDPDISAAQLYSRGQRNRPQQRT